MEVRIRLGLHTGEPVVGEGGYTGLDVVRASRIAATARGGQVLLSGATAAIVANHLPDGVSLKPLGKRRLKDIDEPEPIVELVIPDVPVTPSAVSALAPARTRLPADVTEDMPAWLQEVAGRFLPPTNRLIEDRVLAKIEKAFKERDRPPAEQPRATRRRRSVADEIDRLRALRDSGSLTDAQYELAVERALAEDR